MDNLRESIQKIIPTVYDESLSYYEVLQSVIEGMNTMFGLFIEFEKMAEEVNNKLDTLNTQIYNIVVEELSTWLGDGTLEEAFQIVLADKADKTYVDAQLASVDSELATKATIIALDATNSELNEVRSDLEQFKTEIGDNVTLNKRNIASTYLDNSNNYCEVHETVTENTKHNAFTSLVRFNGEYYLFYRVGTTHTSIDGKIVYKKSSDMSMWGNEVTVLSQAGKDFRDPKAIVYNGKLVLKYFYRESDQHARSRIAYSTNGTNFTESADLPTLVGHTNNATSGNMAVIGADLYMVNYTCYQEGGTGSDIAYLMKTDLTTYTIVSTLRSAMNEVSLASVSYAGTTKLYFVGRQGTLDENNSDYNNPLVFGVSSDNGLTFKMKDLPLYGHAPSLHLLDPENGSKDKRLIVTYRDSSYREKQDTAYHVLATLNVNGDMVGRPYVLSRVTLTFDIGYGDVYVGVNEIYFAFYLFKDLGRIYVKRLPRKIVQELGNVMQGTNILAINESGVKSTQTIRRRVEGVNNFTGNGTASVTKVLDFSSLKLTKAPIHVDIAILNSTGQFVYNIESISATQIVIVFRVLTSTFTSTIPFTYAFNVIEG